MILRPKNWRDFQHYKDRSPPWIRLHRALLDDYDFQRLPVASRALAPMLWLLAACSSDLEHGDFDASPDKMAFRLRMGEDEFVDACKPLITAGFFSVQHCASTALAIRLQDAVPETETETEERQRVSADADAPAPADDEKPSGRKACPHQQIIAIYHEVLPELRQVRQWSEARQKLLARRWAEDPDRQTLEWWRDYFGYVRLSKFLMGQVTGRDGRAFDCDLEWLVKPSNFVKVLEGKYEDQAA